LHRSTRPNAERAASPSPRRREPQGRADGVIELDGVDFDPIEVQPLVPGAKQGIVVAQVATK
jgi:hypothetical protein